MKRSDFDDVITALIVPGGPGAAVGVRHRGEMIHAAGYGLADVEWGNPIDTDTVFRIGSISKQFTAAAILRLADEGRLSIDDRVEAHLPDYPLGGRTITLRHLLNHTSGIKSYTAIAEVMRDRGANDVSVAQIIDVFKDRPADFQPGERYLYNNSGYVLLTAVIEAVSGKRFETFLREDLLDPLGLSRTSYLHARPLTPKRAHGYDLGRHGLVNCAWLAMSWPQGAGALGSTVNDLLAWDAALHSGQVLSPASYAAMIEPGRLNDGSAISYGLGLARRPYRGRPVISHGGGINGFLTHLAHYPDEDLSVVVLSNLSSFEIERATYSLVRRALGLADVVRTPATLDAAQLGRAAGVYGFQVGPLTLTAADGVLESAFPRPGSVYRPYAEDAFFLERDPEVTLAFEDLRDGAYQRAVYRSYGDPERGERTHA
ncbi:MAG TPA: serine hydrolase domain-containing protein [Caulobacteraceae bacterium]|nr:serine hydrolase domain-containing protein [Caulobacteraceae bacterium]